MFISCIKLSKKLIIALVSIIAVLLIFFLIWYFAIFKQAISTSSSNSSEDDSKSYIKWFEFKVPYNILVKTSDLDIKSHNENKDIKYNWIELISYLACKYGNDFKRFKQSDLDSLITRLNNGETMESITKDMKNYSYYFEGYSAVLSQFIGEYEIQEPNSSTSKTSTNENTDKSNNSNTNSENANLYTKVYGIKAFHPLAQNYSYSHYDDFGNSRSYGYKRLHFGNDLMGSIGTPVIAVESGIVEAVRLESIWWLEGWHS